MSGNSATTNNNKTYVYDTGFITEMFCYDKLKPEYRKAAQCIPFKASTEIILNWQEMPEKTLNDMLQFMIKEADEHLNISPAVFRQILLDNGVEIN